MSDNNQRKIPKTLFAAQTNNTTGSKVNTTKIIWISKRETWLGDEDKTSIFCLFNNEIVSEPMFVAASDNDENNDRVWYSSGINKICIFTES